MAGSRASASAIVPAMPQSCTRWVRNEWDGSVTMEIQGTEEAIDKVILAEQSRTDRNQSAVKADAQRQGLFRSHLY